MKDVTPPIQPLTLNQHMGLVMGKYFEDATPNNETLTEAMPDIQDDMLNEVKLALEEKIEVEVKDDDFGGYFYHTNIDYFMDWLSDNFMLEKK